MEYFLNIVTPPNIDRTQRLLLVSVSDLPTSFLILHLKTISDRTEGKDRATGKPWAQQTLKSETRITWKSVNENPGVCLLCVPESELTAKPQGKLREIGGSTGKKKTPVVDFI